jgi:putative membrane protein
MKKTLISAALISTILGLAAGCSSTASAPATAAVNPQDLNFVTAASQLIQFDLAECTITQHNVLTAPVTAVAEKDCADAAHYSPILSQQAAAMGVTLPNDLRYDLKAEFVQLNYNPVPSADVAFLTGQIGSHESALAVFQDEAKNGSNPQLIALAAQTAPVAAANLDALRAALHGLNTNM